MNLAALKSNFTRGFNRWILGETVRRPLILFRIAFATIWLIYDVIDLSMAQTLKNVWFIRAPFEPRIFIACQVTLIFFELGLLIGFKARWFAFAAFVARGLMCYLFALNDFLYYTVTALILSQSDCEKLRKKPEALAWPRDVLILQTAYIYLASAVLKMNPLFLSGGDLYVRQNYTARVMPFYYPNFYVQWISSLSGNALLAWAAVTSEMTLALLLFAWWLSPQRRLTLRPMIILLTVGIHGYALYTVDVFFFSASMMAQVILLTTVKSTAPGRALAPQ